MTERKKIARVFPQRNSYTPDDSDAYFDAPDMFTPHYSECRISCTFTWDKERAESLAKAWKYNADKVIIGGVAYGSYAGEFVPGLYTKHGITITSRGCPNKCGFCVVPRIEGDLRELDIKPGHIIQDNNILACSKQHLEKVFSMLKQQKSIEFRGGLECGRITKTIAENLRGLRIYRLWLACDSRAALTKYAKAIEILRNAGFSRHRIYCYVLCGKDIEEETDRLKTIYRVGSMPFAQLYQPYLNTKIQYTEQWRNFQRQWTRPAIYKSFLRETPND